MHGSFGNRRVRRLGGDGEGGDGGGDGDGDGDGEGEDVERTLMTARAGRDRSSGERMRERVGVDVDGAVADFVPFKLYPVLALWGLFCTSQKPHSSRQNRVPQDGEYTRTSIFRILNATARQSISLHRLHILSIPTASGHRIDVKQRQDTGYATRFLPTCVCFSASPSHTMGRCVLIQ